MAEANEGKIETLTKRIAQMNDRQRRRNLRFTGISEDIQNKDLEGAMLNWLKEQGIKIKQEEIERAHRLFTPRRGAGAPRDVIVAFSREKLRDEIYKSLRQKSDLQFKERKVIVRQDFSQEMLQVRRSTQQFAQALFNGQIPFTWAYPATLVVYRDSKKYSARDSEEARKMLTELGVELQGETVQELSSQEEDVQEEQTDSPVQEKEQKRRKGLGGGVVNNE